MPSFTGELAKSVAVTPKYIEEKIARMNADLWNIVKQLLSEHGYRIDESGRTATLPEGVEPPQLFYYWTGSRNVPYKGLKNMELTRTSNLRQGGLR